MFDDPVTKPQLLKRVTALAAACFMAAIATGVLFAADEDTAPAASYVWNLVAQKQMSEIEFSPEILGSGWQSSPGVRFDDINDTKGMTAERRSVAESLAGQLSPLGIRAVGDFTLVKGGNPLNTVTVRVFIFEDAEKCRAWWPKKYEYDGWDQHYTSVASERAVSVDSRQTNKRAMAFGNVWLTAHQLGDGEEHIVAAEHIVDQLINGR